MTAPPYSERRGADPPGLETARDAGSVATAFGEKKTFAEAAADRRPLPVKERQAAEARTPAAGGRGTGSVYWPGLDGLRAVAVVAVLIYHAGVRALPGGLLGVDMFFVLSGFLITTLLLDERVRTGTIGLRRFWARRVRRLLPALLLLLVAVAFGATLLVAPGDITSLRSDALSALLYVANWRFALSGQSYFDVFGRPSPLLHLWSLGVEEQFYLFWPLVLLLVARRARRPARAVGLVATVLLAGSTALLVVLHAHGADTSRLYYGTDTRALTLLVGAALACALHSGSRPASRHGHLRTLPRGRHRRRFRDRTRGKVLVALLGTAGAGGLGVAFATVNGEDPRLYEGGFLLVALCAAAVLGSVVLVPKAPLSRLLALTPLVLVGRLSYGLYLWHWPVFLALDGSRTGLRGPLLLGLRLAGTAAISTASYLLVERPIRQRRWRRPRMLIAAPTASLVTAGAVAVATLPGVLPGVSPARGDAGRDALASIATQESAAARQALSSPALPAKPSAAEPLRVLVVGDSVALTTGAALRRVQSQWQVVVENGGILGCGLAPGNRSRSLTDRAFPGGEPCTNWPNWWRDLTRRFKPDVVIMLSGRWETFDRYVGGRSISIGQPQLDQPLLAAMNKAVATLSGTGAKVGMVTTPCIAPAERADGSLDPTTDPARVRRYNDLLRQAAQAHQDVAQIIDLNALLCPGGHYTPVVDGQRVRTDDGIHVNPSAGSVIAPLLLGGVRTMVGLPARPAH